MKLSKKRGLCEWRLSHRRRVENTLPPTHHHDAFALETCVEGKEPKMHGWLRAEPKILHVSYSSEEEWLAERAKHALIMLRACVEVDPGKHGGIPVLRGTRFPVAQVFAEMSEGISIVELAADFDLDVEVLKQLLEALAINLDRPFAK